MKIVHQPLAKTNDPQTSHVSAAATAASLSAESLARALLGAYQDGSELTDDEAYARITSHTSDYPRRRNSDLRRKGLIEQVRDSAGHPLTRIGTYGRPVMVCRITSAGRAELLQP